MSKIKTQAFINGKIITYGEGIVQGVVKATQTGILWSQVQVLVGPPESKPSSAMMGALSFMTSDLQIKLKQDSNILIFCAAAWA